MASTLLVYTHQITPRLSYIFKHIFVRILNIPIKFASTIEEFVAHDGLKMTYTKAPLGSEFFVQSNSLLFEQGIDDIDITVTPWDSNICFFPVGKKSIIPFDIFAASFYLLSRYEEYIPFVLDQYDCFPAEESLAFKNHFLEKPVIDIWAHKLLKALQNKYPDFVHQPKQYHHISNINVNHTYLYQSKGLIRSIVDSFYDLARFRIYSFGIRLAVLSTFKKDPYDTYDSILRLKKEYKVDTQFFFLISNFTTYDTNISYTKLKYRLLIKSIADYAKVGLINSYFTIENQDKMKLENERLSKLVNIPTQKTKQQLNRFKLPKTYQNLIDLDVTEDYSMGYYNHVGFRASTCTPFYFYDLNFEIQTPLKVFPYAFSDRTLKFEMELSYQKSLAKIQQLKNAVAQVNGTLVSEFHNSSLSGYMKWKYWENLYEDTLKIVEKK